MSLKRVSSPASSVSRSVGAAKRRLLSSLFRSSSLFVVVFVVLSLSSLLLLLLLSFVLSLFLFAIFAAGLINDELNGWEEKHSERVMCE